MGKIREKYPYTRDYNLFPPITPEHAQAIGYVAAHWSFIEAHLSAIIRFLLGLPPVVEMALLAEIATLPRMTMIRALLQLTANQDLLDEWDEITPVFNDLRSKRNDAIHGEWEVVSPGHFLKRTKAKSDLRFEFGHVDTKVLHQLSRDILALSDHMVSFASGVIYANTPKILGDHFLAVQGQVPSLLRSAPSQGRTRKTRQRKPSSAQRRASAKHV